MKHYRAVFIDWDDTIGDFHGAAKKALQEMYEKYHLCHYFASHEEFISLYKPHNIELWDKYGKDLVSKEYLSFDRFFYPLMHGSKVCERLSYDKVLRMDLCALAERLSEDFLHMTTAHFALLEGAEDLIRYLAAKYPLTVVTNGFVEVQYEKFEKSGLKDCFAHIVLSEEVGCQKPNPLIFEEALRMNGLDASEVVMIGDSFSSDIAGANTVGIDTIWLAQPDNITDEQSKVATYIVTSLQEIKQLL